MCPRFNFLARRTALSKTISELQRRFPKKSAAWINARAQQAVGPDDIAAELRAPARHNFLSRDTK